MAGDPGTTKVPKGILKSPSQSFTPPSNPSTRFPELDRDDIKEILKMQQTIFNDSMFLIDFPRSQPPEFTAAHPDRADVAEFTNKIINFKLDDYDGLVQERNAEKKCGYVLCSNKHRTFNKGQMVLVDRNRPGFTVMSGEEMAKWCSDNCMRRALYIKVQLGEVLRTKIELIDERDLAGPSAKPSPVSDNASRRAKDAAHAEAKRKQDQAVLAHERGEPRRPGPGRTTTLTIREKKVDAAPVAPIRNGPSDHMNIEGHATKSGEPAAGKYDSSVNKPPKGVDDKKAS